MAGRSVMNGFQFEIKLFFFVIRKITSSNESHELIMTDCVQSVIRQQKAFIIHIPRWKAQSYSLGMYMMFTLKKCIPGITEGLQSKVGFASLEYINIFAKI
jgi:hypothetical protein